ncbi:hypothetical protein N7478_012511 [Penicillium angulare]|uniref:uncharacterized protein n=1 Tax=Penicillium angulare TaxID=116970 RepID=UPI00253FEFA3|nr:uncharacterized protein N7478_012511 [Penicillium angulare]KAJ5259530.1 hypothetical protein N7478_012511 [Penicillium angulare]
MALKLSGTAYITGAGSGIGRFTALAFARHGVTKLALVDLKQEGLEETQKLLKASYPEIETLLLQVDVADEVSVQGSIKRAVDEFKRIDIGLNCAGIAGPHIPTHEMPLDKWQEMIQINQTGVFLCQKHLIAQMLQQESLGVREGRGTIINASSMFGVFSSPAFLGITPYVASKHAVMGLTKADARVYAPMGIRINAICPGWVDTPMISKGIENGALNPEFQRTPVGRPAKPEEISDALVFLASPMASYMHGVGLNVNGGYSL